ncbi:hypothetical protein [Chitinophaga sp. CF418]|uniref:hypothetical protein n=1 Tax=Chitinophaga sp. CF418 TaxID=1855287 RepID=UPI000921633D|nr:hypothetical protein [Chitinophaga sp. CF418]SHM53113.1 hypothetical protein SAMN05216311_102419 [Chitinophaga sp. CF418]
MVYVNSLRATELTRDNNIANTALISGFQETVMVATRMYRGAGLVDNAGETIIAGVRALPEIERDD